ncbi:MAG TPA: secretin N-terminal domain-containing protein [Pyrinomonadaceae bacterium]|nr:secretin N-terminal domain-containing protein [Pyrinomonadaceae bacterium]
MKTRNYLRLSLSLMLLITLLSPVSVLAMGDGKKHFKEGMQHENSEQWDKAAEAFALAVAENPKNPEYRLHYQRALFNASQMFMKRGNMQASQKDYAGAYLSFRKAYGYDPVNELAKSEMERMLRLQRGLENGDLITQPDGTVKLVKTALDRQSPPLDVEVPQRLERLRDVTFPGGVDLQFLIKDLAKDLDLNVLFDADSWRNARQVKIELKSVTAAKALDYIFLQEGLFFQRVGPRTILVANQNRRQFFQQLVLRTFYLANADPKEVAKVVQTAIPVQPGRTPTIPLIDASTNSLTVRDTSENIKIIADLIKALDKDRPEVVMDVAIYEVSKTDLLRIGNQIGISPTANAPNQLNNLGGSNAGVIPFNGNFGASLATAIATGIILPSSVISAFQSKNNTRLLASTQIHAFNNEDSSARIGQRVPVQTAQLLGYSNQPGQPQNNFGNAASIVNYEQVGLTLKFTPIVFPNQDVQVKMEIESKDVAAGPDPYTPTFTERTIKGTARVQNNKTLLLASVAQGVESEGRAGFPVLGWIPFIGRLFATPTKDNRQVDIIIAITPKVIRAPSILPEDEVERPTGSMGVPTTGSLEAMIIQEERDEQLAAARRIPNVAKVQLPDRKEEEPAYVQTTSAQTTSAPTNVNASTETKTENQTAVNTPKTNTALATNLKPIDTSVKTLQITPTVDSAGGKVETKETSLKINEEEVSEPQAEPVAKPLAELQFLPQLPEMKAGEKTKVAVMVRSATAFRSSVLGLKFDNSKVAVRSVSFGDVFGKDIAQTTASPFLNQNGKMYVSLSTSKDIAENSSGILAYIEIEALADGKPEITFDSDVLNFLTANGKSFTVKF